MNTKTITCAIALLTGIAANASIPSYQVYDIKMSAKTTSAKGVTTIETCSGESDYCYRDKANVTIKGVLAGCGCGAILANGSCKNAILYMWDETHKVAITNIDTDTGWNIQCIGKKIKTVEHFMRFNVTYGLDDLYSFNITMCGFGNHKYDSKNPSLSYANGISGYFAGLSKAPYYYNAGKCSACECEDDVFEESIAIPMCECTEYDTDCTPELTPFYGSYSIKYNSSKSKNASKNGLSQKILGLPSYVGLEDYAEINIEE